MSAVAGRVLIIPKGAYVAGTTYNMLDLVKYNSKSFLAKRTNTNVTPVDGADWMELTNDGVTSFNGRSGAVNPANGDYNMTNLGDVNLTNPTDGQGLRYNAQSEKWENGDAASAVSNLTDVDLTNLANGQILKYNSTAQKWENVDEKGHTIQNASGTAQTQRANMQFPDSHVSDDSTNGRTIVENVKEVTLAELSQETERGLYLATDEESVPYPPTEEDVVSVTADGVKTFAQLLNDIFNDSKFDITKVTKDSILKIGESIYFPTIISTTYNYARFIREVCNSTSLYLEDITISSSSTVYATTVNGSTYNRENDSSTVEPNGMVITLYYGTSSGIVELNTDARHCMMSDGVTSVEGAINGVLVAEGVGATRGAQLSSLYSAFAGLSAERKRRAYILIEGTEKLNIANVNSASFHVSFFSGGYVIEDSVSLVTGYANRCLLSDNTMPSFQNMTDVQQSAGDLKLYA